MAATPPSNTPSGNEPNPQPAPLMLEDKLNEFWKKNRMIVLGLCAFVFLAILGKGVWERIQERQELDVRAAYAAATTTEQLRAFAAAHRQHALAGLAELRIADEAYAAGKSADAVAAYDRVVSLLKKGPLAARAQLGRALAKVQAGKAADGVADLKQILNDATLLKAVRAEAAYQLASLAADSGNVAEVQKYVEQLNQIDPASLWSRRAMTLQASLPPAAAASLPGNPATPPPAAKEQSGPQIKLPGK